jgi:hypothetical protein
LVRSMQNRSYEVRKAWRYSGRHRVLPIEPEWLRGAEYVVVQRLDDGALLLRPARGVKDEGEAARLEVELNGEA